MTINQSESGLNLQNSSGPNQTGSSILIVAAHLTAMPRNDDFFYPSETDYTEPCADDSSIVYGNIVLPFGAGLSVVCYLYLMWMYFVLQSPIFKRHPTSKH